jgi:hypothetical protein
MAQGSKFHFHGFQRIWHVKLRFDPESADENNQQAEEQEKAKDNAYANPIPTPAARIKEHKSRAAHKTTQRSRLLTRLQDGMSHGDTATQVRPRHRRVCSNFQQKPRGLFDAILDVTQESDGLLPVYNTIVVA